MRQGLRRRAQVAGPDLLPSEVEASTQHPGGKHHDNGNNQNDNPHHSHDHVHVGLVLGLPLSLLGFLGREMPSDKALGVLRLLAREDALNEFFDL